MAATVLRMSDHRAVFVLPDRVGTVVFLATRGPVPRLAHEQSFEGNHDASKYARALSVKFGCTIVGAMRGIGSDEDVA